MEAEDILKNYTVNGTCWEWNSGLRRGYGRVWRNGKDLPSHRVFY
jgi:hypothetical protein